MSSKAKVLVVADNKLTNFESLLRGLADEIVTVTSEASELAALNNPHDLEFAVILIDVGSSPPHGFETARSLREFPNFNETPFIFITESHGGISARLQEHPLGSVDYIYKPAEETLLRTKVAVFIESFRNEKKLKDAEQQTLNLMAVEKRHLVEAERLRKQVEFEKKTVEGLMMFRMLVENVVDYGIFLMDPDGYVISWNIAAERILGFAEEEIIGQHFSKIFTVSDIRAGVPAEELRKAYATGRAEDIRWHVRNDGRHFWADGVVTPLRDESGELKGYAKLLRDNTERKRAGEALKSSEERFRVLFEAVTDYAIFTLDLQGHVTSWNTGATQMTGYDEAEILGHSFVMLYSDEDQNDARPIKALEKAKLEGRAEDARWHPQKNGNLFWAEGVVTALYGDNGEVRGYAKVMRNRTRQKRSDEELTRLTDALTKSNEGLEHYASIASHDLQEPLRTITSHLSLIQRQLSHSADEKLHASMKFAMDASKRMKYLISDLLQYSRLGTDKKTGPVDCEQVFSTVLGNLELNIKENHVQIEHEKLPTVRGIRYEIMQVFQNLISNGIKFRRAESTKIEVSCKKDDLRWIFCVKDNGIGIEKTNSEKIFDPFQKLHSQSEYPGTGLGLAVCKRIVESLGGNIWLESVPGRGSSFYFSLPAWD